MKTASHSYLAFSLIAIFILCLSFFNDAVSNSGYTV